MRNVLAALLILGLSSFGVLQAHAASPSSSALVFPSGELIRDVELESAVGLQFFTAEEVAPYSESPTLLVGGRSVGQMWADFKANPGNWRSAGAFVEPSRSGGVSIQEKFVNVHTGEHFWRHTVTNDRGDVVDGPHPRRYFSDHFGEYSGIKVGRFY